MRGGPALFAMLMAAPAAAGGPALAQTACRFDAFDGAGTQRPRVVVTLSRPDALGRVDARVGADSYRLRPSPASRGGTRTLWRSLPLAGTGAGAGPVGRPSVVLSVDAAGAANLLRYRGADLIAAYRGTCGPDRPRPMDAERWTW